MLSQVLLAPLFAKRASAFTSDSFAPPAECPTCLSANYTGMPNGSLPLSPWVSGAAYDQIITIWLENTDFAAAAASSTFQKLAAEGILLTNYNGVTHPSEPNYLAAVGGDFWGIGDDEFYAIPSNASTVVDLLEAKNVSWATYQESMPTDGDGEFAYYSHNYLNASAPDYRYYVRKHNPFVIYNSIASIPDRALRIRNFNDFAVDVNASALPQYVWITPNLVNDAHDTDVTFVSAWLEYWLVPLLQNPKFNTNKTLIQVTFDENESYTIQNTVYTVLLGGAVPSNLKGTNDSTFYTHYSLLSSVQNNWDLGNLGRQDTNATVAAVFDFQANITKYQNTKPSSDPMMNLTGIFPGPGNTEIWTPVLAPNTSAKGAGSGKTYYNASVIDLTLTSYTHLNLTAMNAVNPDTINPNYTYNEAAIANATNKPTSVPVYIAPSTTSGSPSGTASGSKSASSAATTSGGAVKLATGAGGSLAVIAAGIIALL
ncbi:phosphoesterase family-domain-containing protein [Kockovaella imperatae]|uniref:Phosphoesterase family-domain-containing protein n=1 Tax=Kockovaella imperatae TaxID=4999 RepID=A0A1Y1U5Z5_9TREE|nr:phosphoesterase family-domain-containing protein [Kockovaella imperatae]ORX33461.1 phosphoesterase family-domain-containing protein [Kockovaella imperatae]